MLNHLRPAFVLVFLMTGLTGLAFPLAITRISQAAMPFTANGSLIEQKGTVIGSRLIGQNFVSDRYFWPRPSATSPYAYNAASSSGSNLGATSAKLRDRINGEVERLASTGISRPVPADAVTASGSGLDPHISPAFARAQVERVAKARGLEQGKVSALVEQHIEAPAYGIIGEPRINVLELNLALDAMAL
ncbi:potassium-transporting ATPase subunit KdpC [Rhizobium helianthi]|uniref:Potassium-transporting ATPase KdpC subunit n=1 Tax=Rhizobium helianthi TaxID=1132695 RepID=A0ABW4M806_9HYPH